VVSQRPTAPTPTVVPSHATVTKHPPKAKRKKTHRKTVHKKAKPIPVAPKAAQVPVPVRRTVAIVSPNKPVDSGMFILLGMIGLAFACLAVAAVPAAYVRWRPAAHFVARRNLDLAIVGLALLLLAGFTFFVTHGS
jgi:hypothetical protein